MTESILFVDDTPAALDIIARLFSGEFLIHTARDAQEALELCRERGPFAIVVSDYEMPGQRGGELLASIHEAWPDTVTMLLTGVVEVDVAIEALHEACIFRFLEKPCPREVLGAALRDGLKEHARRRELRLQTRQLDFSRQCLQQFNGELEERIQEQSQALLRLQRFVAELSSCETLEQVAIATAEAAHEVCEVEGARVEFDARTRGAERTVCECGQPPASGALCLPIGTAECELGTLFVPSCDRWGGRLKATRRDMLASVASSAAVAARNALRRHERDVAQQATIFALAKLAEQRDNETGKHLERVSEYCRLIAEGLRADGWYRELISDDWLDVLVKSAPLHDIGKVGIPDQILLKPGKLTPEEWRVMRTHTDVGAETLRSVLSSGSDQPFLRMSLDIAWCHHERWDGGGYPRGLAGENIPLSARILALADVYDALTSERPYKHAWSHGAALEWILQGSGTHFDPRVVDAFATRAARADGIRARLADTAQDLALVGKRPLALSALN